MPGWRLQTIEGVQRRDQPDGSVGLAVRGIEFARATSGGLLFGLEEKSTAAAANLSEMESLAVGLSEMRHAGAADGGNPLYSRRPEAWLDSQIYCRHREDRRQASPTSCL